MFATTYEDPRMVFARAAAKNQDPLGVADDMLNADAPPDATWAWWLAYYQASVRRRSNPQKP